MRHSGKSLTCGLLGRQAHVALLFWAPQQRVPGAHHAALEQQDGGDMRGGRPGEFRVSKLGFMASW